MVDDSMMSISSGDSPPPLLVRKRAATKVLLGPEYPKNLSEILEPPKPERDASRYDKDRIKQGLIFAESTLNDPIRKLSPLGQRAFMHYKDACARWIDLDNHQNSYDEKECKAAKAEWVTTIRYIEDSWQHHSAMELTKTKNAQELQDEILSLMKTSFYAKYGDYFAQVCNDLKTTAREQNVKGWKSLHGKYWSNMWIQIEREEPLWERVSRGEKVHNQCPTHYAIMETCGRIGLEMDEVMAIIKHYAIRNTLLHANFIELVRKQKYAPLARTLNSDFCDLHHVAPVEDGPEARLMFTMIKCIIDKWFVQPKEADVDTWYPTAELLELAKSLNAKDADEAQVNSEMSAMITKEVKQRVRQQLKEKAIADDVHEALREFGDLDMRIAKRKRVASSQLAKKRRQDYDEIVGAMCQLRQKSMKYEKLWGELAPPPELIGDKSMGDDK